MREEILKRAEEILEEEGIEANDKFYVKSEQRQGSRLWYMLGPFDSSDEAESWLPEVIKHCENRDPQIRRSRRFYVDSGPDGISTVLKMK